MAIKLVNVSYNDYLHDITYSFIDGKITTILSSSDDKEILLKIIKGEIKDYTGKIISDYHGNNISYCPLNNSLLGKSIYEELSLSLKKYNYKEETILKRAEDALKMVHLDKSYLNRNSNSLSKGEKVLLSLAISLITNPKIILLDDPSGYLDSNNTNMVIKLLRKIAKKYNKIIIVLADDIEFAYLLGDSYLLLKDGKIVSSGEKKDLITNYPVLIKNGLKEEKIMEFINYIEKNKGITLNKTYDIKELMKDIYRNVK